MNIIIVGRGKVGCTLVEALSDENHDIVVIDSRPEKVSALTDTVDVMGDCWKWCKPHNIKAGWYRNRRPADCCHRI